MTFFITEKSLAWAVWQAPPGMESIGVWVVWSKSALHRGVGGYYGWFLELHSSHSCSTIKSCEVECDLGVSLDCDLTWHAQVSHQAARANKLLGFVRRNSRFIHSTSVRRTLYLGLVRAHLGYATQVWAPQGIELISKLESIQRRATKFILCLPFLTNISYKERLMSVNLLPVCYWYELLDLVYSQVS